MIERHETQGYVFDFVRGGPALFITFEPAGEPNDRSDGTRKGWGQDFLVKRGFSVIAVKPKRVDWYRGRDIHESFRRGFVKEKIGEFRDVYLYGGSMGGYAALAFAEAAPGCTVIALNPQTSLSRDLVPWETRFQSGAAEDWQGDFADGVVGARYASRVYVAYDPLFRLDRKQVERLDSTNVVKLRVPFVGHRVPFWLQRMGILSKLVDGVVAGSMTESSFRELALARRALPRYFVQMAKSRGALSFKRKCVERALIIDPTDREALSLFCEVLIGEGRFVETLAISEHALKGAGLEFSCRAFHKLGALDRVDKALLDVGKSNDAGFPQRVRAAEIALELGRWETADRLVSELRKNAPNRPRVRQLSDRMRAAGRVLA